ncbi:hypothetical protein HMJ29_17015 [Hymenobacter taeanensis]|uniref:Uncharacterized protein n=1 Tax=Hymenobacter taeanensis TaxID=2735321 RepID=A0A6M6BL18_9BACT|nr:MULTISPECIES: hypothetical protein [Hymenobacter]QJX48524.1 hypothetical protein HMJ29_17015 [Hymenobacter taeanensis]UOQ81978.1 hypothetical protein MUN83_04095 [Hymenobacter sp. 5414T-23]
MNTRNETPDASQSAEQRQPEGQQFPGSHDTGMNADDNSGSGGTEGGQEIKGARVRSGAPNYDAPGNAQDGDVGGNSISSGSGVSGGETGKVTL